MGQGFIDLYLKEELTLLVVCLLIGALLMVPRQILGFWFHRRALAGKGFMAHPITKRSVTLFQTVYRENPEVLEEGLKKLRASLDKHATMSAIVCVIDAADIFPEEAEELGAIAKRYGANVFCTNARAKRENLRNGMRWAGDPKNHQALIADPFAMQEAVVWARQKGVLYDISLFHDSDSIPTTPDDDIVGELLRPFADPTIGCVTTAQRLTKVDSTLQTLLDWLEDGRVGSGMAAASLVRQVVCAPGRLYAVRTVLVEDMMERLVNEYWWVPKYSWRWPFVTFERVQAHAGDDRRITMFVQEKGFGVVMNPRASVVTTMPRTLWLVTLVLLRWATSSQWLTVLGTRHAWYRRLWFVMYLAWGDIIITFIANFILFRFVYSLAGWFFGWGDPTPFLTLTTWFLVTFIGIHLSFGLRQLWHLYKYPLHLLLLTVFILFVTYLQLIRLIPWLNPRRIHVWGSRKGSGLRVAQLFFTPYDVWLTERRISAK